MSLALRVYDSLWLQVATLCIVRSKFIQAKKARSELFSQTTP